MYELTCFNSITIENICSKVIIVASKDRIYYEAMSNRLY
jgi:hypothetical protein